MNEDFEGFDPNVVAAAWLELADDGVFANFVVNLPAPFQERNVEGLFRTDDEFYVEFEGGERLKVPNIDADVFERATLYPDQNVSVIDGDGNSSFPRKIRIVNENTIYRPGV